jgi:NitT/TauT family transport system ATP-binding protein
MLENRKLAPTDLSARTDAFASRFVDVASADLFYGEDNVGFLALQRVSSAIARGEYATVVGSSACGKLTLLKLISGLRLASASCVVVPGVEVKAPLKSVGVAFQNPILAPWRTTPDNLLQQLEFVRSHRQRISRRNEGERYEFPRPRTAEMRYRSDFIEYVHQLCTHIGRACEAT